MWGQELAELGWIWASLVLRQVNVVLLANEVVLMSVMPKIPKMKASNGASECRRFCLQKGARLTPEFK